LDNPAELPVLLDHTENVIGKAQRMLSKLKLISEAESSIRGVHKISLYRVVERVTSEHVALAKSVNAHVSAIVTGEAEVAFSFDILETLLSNLVENALIFHRKIDNAFVRISADVSFGWLTMRVEDNGQGITEEQMKSIFDMYNRLNENSKGNGLGLYLVKKITEKLHGVVKVDSTWGEGSVFEVKIRV
jgi:signal transduction histidine kinase